MWSLIMKNLIILTLTLSATSVLAFSKDDLKTLKSAEGLYLLEATQKTNEDQSRICLEGALEFKEAEGTLMLAGTPLAVGIHSKDKEPVASTEKNDDGCVETASAQMTKKVLTFETSVSCPADKTDFQVKRTIEFKAKDLIYRQLNVANLEKIEVECRLKRSNKKPETWKIQPEVEEVKTN